MTGSTVPLRKRLSLIAACAVAVAVALAVTVCYLGVRAELLSQVDNELILQKPAVVSALSRILGRDSAYGGAYFPGGPPSAGGAAPYSQVVNASDEVLASIGNVELPINAGTRSVINGATNNLLQEATVGGADLRILTFRAYELSAFGQEVPVAVQLARPLGPIDHVLSDLRLILLLLLLGGIAVAALLGRIAANRVLAPLAEVTKTAQLIGETDDLSRRLAVHADDEVGQLANRFNEMLARLEQSRDALDESVRAQRQLVADASHELRTPVTSLRTNVEVLLAGGQLDDEDRERLLADVVEQSEELSALVSDLIELARGDLPPSSTEDVRLDRVVEESLARARRNAPDVDFIAELAPVIVEGVPERLGRAVNNLLDNAARHTGPDGPVEVVVDRDGLRVRDHGTGISQKDLPHVFDRFYRGENARGRQGSGLGLAIVRQAALQHGGTVSATNAFDGGAVFRLRLPTAPATGSSCAEEQDADTGALTQRL
ncbi:MAG: sensor histidine kinase [Solirubrobacteraceae bacterium]